jgi:hypothetical protein
LWTKYRNAKGYGIVGHNGRTYLVPRVSMMLFRGFDINSPLDVLHSCDTPACFNPAHLRPGTPKENVRDSIERGRWSDKRGEKNGRAKPTGEEVQQIRSLYSTGVTRFDLHKMFSTPLGTIDSILTRRTWRHLPDLPGSAA